MPGLSGGPCRCGSCGSGCEPVGPQRCRCVPVPSWTSGRRCSRCTTAPSRPETWPRTGLLQGATPTHRQTAFRQTLYHNSSTSDSSSSDPTYQYKPVSLQSPVRWSPGWRRLPPAERLHPVNPWTRRRPEPLCSERGRHTEPSGNWRGIQMFPECEGNRCFLNVKGTRVNKDQNLIE